MANKKKSQTAAKSTATTTAAKASNPSTATALTLLTILGGLSILWALFLWKELVDVRSTGKDPFCAFGENECGLLWDAAFASAVHNYTGLPVAAWGVVWGIVALLMPLHARKAEGRNTARRLNAVKWTAIAGLAGLVVLLAVSASDGLFCTSCALTYVLTLAYGGVVFFMLKSKMPLSMKGLEVPAGVTVAAFLLLLYPGLSTPKSQAREDQRMLEEAARRQTEQRLAEENRAKQGPTDTGQSVASGEVNNGDVNNGEAGTAADAKKAELDRQLREFLDGATPEFLQEFSNALHQYREAIYHEEEPRFLRGSYAAQVRVTEFTDALCGHCASLHFALKQIGGIVPEDSFSVDARHFPLDGNCNHELPIRGAETVRCAAARAQICMESSPQASEFSGQVFSKQQGLTLSKLYDLSRPFSSPSALKSCMQSDETRAKLIDDVTYAANFKPKGTPLVLVNGKELRSRALVPTLYALIMAGGSPDHPFFASLPAADPDADSHDGHGH